MELILHEYELPLKHPFTISRGTTTAQRTLIVELQQDGVSGYGEAIANNESRLPKKWYGTDLWTRFGISFIDEAIEDGVHVSTRYSRLGNRFLHPATICAIR